MAEAQLAATVFFAVASWASGGNTVAPAGAAGSSANHVLLTVPFFTKVGSSTGRALPWSQRF